MLKEYTFNTGVRPFNHNPPAGMAFMSGFRDSGNGVYVIPFWCEEVPEGSTLSHCYDIDDKPSSEGLIKREIQPGSRIISKYAFFNPPIQLQ